ncbi:SAM-dependent methyltransferase [Streptomyces sp. NPDC058691]|uniref:SAM-dependent methyltransferase n=1 Tax=Streptomyces sp. NPDC058691 TaxID=3346601 RepID=UPI003647323C
MGNDSEASAAYESADVLRNRIDTTRAHPARDYEVFLGGRDNHPVDRDAAAAALAADPVYGMVARKPSLGA